ncbi:MAG: MOSC domain-containing protein [Acidobacteriota bacterium]
MTALKELSQRFASAGRIEAIYLRPARRAEVESVTRARAEPGLGLIGDRRSERRRSGDRARARELTLIQAEHVELIGGWLDIPDHDAGRLRRNVVISGLNLLSARFPFPDGELEWSLGDEVRLVATGPCDPCSRMEDELGRGGYNAMRGHGGVTARLTAGGTLRVGDPVRLRGLIHRTDDD